MSEQAHLSRLFIIGPMGSGKSTVGRHSLIYLAMFSLTQMPRSKRVLGLIFPGFLTSKVKRGFAAEKRRYWRISRGARKL
ncbi:MAG: hypothetical protein CM15mP74_15580 [Halieaceae bacterium]|nr:MAG: hypothetical protein CM15mP74_15580 [Halieaceae bacterium]